MKTTLIILTSTILLSAVYFSNNGIADDKPKTEKEQVGRFTLHIVNKEEEHILYRIDTVTGNVSVFNPNDKFLMSPEDWKQLSPQALFLKEETEKKGLLAYQSPFWRPLPEKLKGVNFQK